MNRVNLKHLHTFVTVVQKNSLSEAAHQLHFTQPAVSKHIQALEKYYGTTLIERSSREFTLTAQGKTLYKYAVEVLQLLMEAENAVQELSTVLKGNLRLGASTVPGQYLLPFYIGAFKEKFPQVKVSLEISSSHDVQRMLLNREIDMGAIGVMPKNKQMDYFELTTDQLVLIASPDHHFAKKKTITVAELSQVPLILRKEGSATKQIVEERLTSAGLDSEDIYKVMELGDTESVKTAVEAGLGLSFVSKWAIQKELQLKNVIPIEVEGINLTRSLYFVYLKQKNRNKVNQSFLDMLLHEPIEKLLKKVRL